VDSLLPSLPALLILAVLEEGAAHGYEIARRVDATSAGVLDLKEGTLYPRLYQLEREGLVVGRWTAAGTARRTRVYELTPAGIERLLEQRAVWRTRVDAADRVLFSEGRPRLGTV
jgi:PadR family transcriptional regulator PadR